MGGGFETFMKCLESDTLLIDTMFLACNRYSVSKAFHESVPQKDQPTRDDLEGYTSRRPVEEDLAWSDLYPELCMWLADYHRKRSSGEDKDGEIRIKF